MASSLSHLPHIKNMKSGINKYDPVHKAIYEVYFTLPEAIQSDALQKTTAAGEQKFYGVTVSFLNPNVDTTAADITIVFNLNLRNETDNFVLKVFRAWENISYDLSDGSRGIKSDYITDNLRIAEANRNGVIWRSYVFHHVMLTSVTGLEGLDYTSNDAVQLTCTFRADFWDDELA